MGQYKPVRCVQVKRREPNYSYFFTDGVERSEQTAKQLVMRQENAQKRRASQRNTRRTEKHHVSGTGLPSCFRLWPGRALRIF